MELRILPSSWRRSPGNVPTPTLEQYLRSMLSGFSDEEKKQILADMERIFVKDTSS